MNREIDQVFWPTWLAVSQLHDGAEVDDRAVLYRQASQQVEPAREALRDMGYSGYDVEHIPYTQYALLDENVLNHNRQDSGCITWLATPLQARYFNTTNAGEGFQGHIRSVLREPIPDTAVITCFYRAITFGFVGHYREQGDERHEDVLEALAAQAKPFKLTYDAPIIVQAPGFSGSRRRWWQAWIVDTMALRALWLTLFHVLQGLVTQLIGQGQNTAQLRGIVNYVLTVILTLLLVWGFSPLSTGVRGGLTVFILLFSIPGIAYGWHQYSQLGSAHSEHEVPLPPESFSGPVVLVCGGNAPLFTGCSGSCEGSQG